MLLLYSLSGAEPTMWLDWRHISSEDVQSPSVFFLGLLTAFCAKLS